jgi:thiol:disulfide interchange protein DsbC
MMITPDREQSRGRGASEPVLRLVSSFMAAIVLVTLCRVPMAGADEYAQLRGRLESALSASMGSVVVVDSVLETEAQELVEVSLANGLVVYATPTGEHFVVGDLYAVKADGLVNLAEQKRETERKALMDSLDVNDMIVFRPEGETRGYITVFTDVTCFYCQKLHREVDDLNARGIEVRYLAYPRGGMDSDGARKLATAWCAEDQQDTLTKLKAGVALPINDCEEAPIAAQYALGQSLGVRGTPAIVTSTGQMIPGYKPADELEQLLGLN